MSVNRNVTILILQTDLVNGFFCFTFWSLYIWRDRFVSFVGVKAPYVSLVVYLPLSWKFLLLYKNNLEKIKNLRTIYFSTAFQTSTEIFVNFLRPPDINQRIKTAI